MGRKLQTIYEYFCDYSEEQIDNIIYNLSLEERIIIRDRYGYDLHNPCTLKSWNNEKEKKYYKIIIPKIKRLLQNINKTRNINKNIEISNVKEDKNNYIPILQPTSLSFRLLQLIQEGRSNEEICSSLNLTNKQLWNMLLTLQNNGLMISKKYYSDGTIKYKKVNRLEKLIELQSFTQDKTIITDTKENSIKFLVISDLHFGNELERLDLINSAYNYCIKNGINIILCGGDLIDGLYTKGKQNISDLYQQIEYFIANYPYDKNILTFSVAGNHDISALFKESLNIINICDNYRHDIIIGGYNNVGINLKNDQIVLYHYTTVKTPHQMDVPIVLHGHLHRYTTEMKGKSLHVTIPSLSDMCQSMPSALQLDITFDNGYIADCLIKHLYFGIKDIVLSESFFDLKRDEVLQNNMIRNVEDYKQDSNIKEEKQLIKEL